MIFWNLEIHIDKNVQVLSKKVRKKQEEYFHNLFSPHLLMKDGEERTAMGKVGASPWSGEGCGTSVGMRGEALPLHWCSYKNRHSSAAGVKGAPVDYR